MKMKLKLIMLIALIVLLVWCTGCSGEKKDVNVADSKATTESKNANFDKKSVEKRRNDQNKAPDEELIVIDLISQNANCFFLNYCDEYLDITSLELTKRKTEEGNDTAYVSAILDNDRYTVKADYVLYYSFYDVGGWILDNYEMVNYKSSAKVPYYTEDEFVSFLYESFNDGAITSRDNGTYEDGTFYDNIKFSGILKYNYMTATITGLYTMYFDDDIWYRELCLEQLNVDWSKVYGTWKYTHTSGDFIEFDVLGIDSVSNNNTSLTMSYITSAWNPKYEDGFVPEPYYIEYDHPEKTVKTRLYDNWEPVSILGTNVELPVSIEYDGVSLGLSVYKDNHTQTNVRGSIMINRDTGASLGYVYSPWDKEKISPLIKLK